MSDEITVRDDPDNHRYIVEVDGERAGFTVYHRRGGRVMFVHTEVDPAFEGRGIGSALARGALDDVRAQGAKIVPLCPFIAGWVDKHPDYADLVDHELLARIDAV
jgi:predicted GNAT family acetyltransferase